MIFPCVKLISRNQRGMTLVELVMAMAVTGIILGAITTTLWQLFTMNTRSINHMTAVRQVQSAGYWVSRDAQMAHNVVTENLTSPEILQLKWTDWDGVAHDVTYSIVNGQLKRTQGGDETVIASHISDDSSETGCSLNDGKLIFTVTATVGGQTETRIYEVVPRTRL